jgi:hypothetical protein
MDLRTPIPYDNILNNTENYEWIEQSFLPTFPADFENTIFQIEKRMKSLYWVFKKGKFGEHSYVLPDEHEVVYNYFFELHPTDISPIFEFYINTSYPKTNGDPTIISERIIKKFKSFDVNLVFKS